MTTFQIIAGVLFCLVVIAVGAYLDIKNHRKEKAVQSATQQDPAGHPAQNR